MKKLTILAMFIALVSSFSLQANEIVINKMHIWKDGVAVSYLVEADLDSITFSQEIIQEAKDITVKAKVPAAWTNVITAWVWPTNGEGKEVVLTKEGDWYVVTEHCVELNLIIKNGEGWDGYVRQEASVDITGIRENVCLVLESDGASKASYVNVDCEDDIEDSTIAEGIGVFSVGEGKTVTFSPGNLQYTQSTNTWSFAENQYDCLGEANIAIDADVLADKIDLFGWSTSTTNFGVSTSESSSDYSGSFVDWGSNKIGNDAPNTWRTLSKDEWEYLLQQRVNAEYLVAIAQVNGINGLIVLPDNWQCPSEINLRLGFSELEINDYSVYQSFSLDQWLKLEEAGAIFLPAAGNRIGVSIVNLQEGGLYWSASEDGLYSAYLVSYFSYEAYVWTDRDMRGVGFSVRLVKDVEGETTDPEQPGEGGEEPETPTNIENGHEYVDLGLPSGLKWATCNVGASTPEEYGDYFAWGETEPKDYYGWSTYKWCNGSDDTQTKYCTKSSYGTVDNKTQLELSDDAARANWGGSWRMPTRAEQDELLENCTWTWTTQNGVNGHKVTSKKNGNSIFLPAASYRYDGSLDYAGDCGYYWSSSLDTDYPVSAYNLGFYLNDVYWDVLNRSYGRSVRPVCDEQSESPSEPEEKPASGVFSVSADKQVTFSPGNLQYTQSTNTWSFASAQWEVLGFDNVTGGSVFLDTVWGEGKNGTALADKIDLFGWGTGNAPTKSSIVNSDYLTFVDWGTNQIGNDAPNTWRTLTKDEWVYIFYNREKAQSLFALGSVNGVNGTIILPDNWTTPAGVSFVASTTKGLYWNGSNYYNDNEDNYSHNTYTSEQWSKMEQAGAVFLPVNGDRWGTDVWNAGSVGYYWSSTAYNNDFAYTVYFLRHFLDPHYDSTSTYGCSVRLVKDVEGESDTPTTPNNPEEPTDPDETEGANDYMLDNFKIGGYGFFDLGDPIAGTDTLLTLSTGDEVTCQLAPSITCVWDNGITWGYNGLTGAGYFFRVENYVYTITDSPNGTYNGYIILGDAISGFDLAVDTIASEDILPYTGKAGQLLDVDMYGDAWDSLYSFAEDTIDEEHYNAIMDKYYAAQTGTQFYYYDFNTEAQIIYSGNVSYLYLKEDNQTGELYYDLKLEWYDNVNEGRSYGLLAETEVNEEGEKIITGIVKPYDMRFIHKHYQQLPSTEKDPTEAPARVQAKAKSAQYTIFNPELSLDRIPQLPSLKKIK